MLYVYIFALVLGGVLLGASIFLGGSDTDVDADVDADFDADADADADGGDALQGQQGLQTEHADAHGSLSGFVASFLSLRFWTFFLAFFGLTGTVLAGLELASSGIAAGLSVGMGLVTGQATVAIIRSLSKSESSIAPTENDYVGKSGRLLVGVGDGLGKVRVEVKGTTVDLLAKSDESLTKGTEVLVVTVEGTTAVVASIGKPVKA